MAPPSLLRRRLLAEFSQARDARLLLVTGPAGSGKSTFLLDFLKQSERPAAWLGLGQEDSDPQLFFDYFLASLQQAYPGCCSTLFRQRFSFQQPLVFYTQVINELLSYGQRLLVVLDDYHLIGSQPWAVDFFALLSRRGPANLCLLLSSRDMPELPLAWLRSKRLVAEVRPEALRFDLEETRDLLGEIWGLQLDEDSLRLLLEKTEGWATGLQLAAYALRGKPSSQHYGLIQHLGAGETDLYAYLAGEVFEALSPNLRQFLFLTALSDSFTPDLALHLLPGVDVEQVLRHLAQARLFLVPLEREGRWYRYHHLFRDFLRQRFLQEHGLALVQETHLRLARWLHQHDELVAAVPHYLASADFQLCSQVLEEVGGTLIQRGLGSSLRLWLQALPPSSSQMGPGARPGLLLLQAELWEIEGDWPQALEGYHQAWESYHRLAETANAARALQKLSRCCLHYGETRRLTHTLESAIQGCPADREALRAVILCCQGSAYLDSGRKWPDSYEVLQAGHSQAYQSADPIAISWAAVSYGFGYHFPQGNFVEALRTLNEGMDFLGRSRWSLDQCQLQLHKAIVLTIMGQLPEASALVQQMMAQTLGYRQLEASLKVLSATIALESRDLPGCSQSLQQVDGRSIPVPLQPLWLRAQLLSCYGLGENHEVLLSLEALESCLRRDQAGLYTLECHLSLALVEIPSQPQRALDRLLQTLELSRHYRAKFWEMKTQQLRAWLYWQQGALDRVEEPLAQALRLTDSNDYQDFWLADPWKMSVPLLTLAIAQNSDLAYPHRLRRALGEAFFLGLDEVLQHPQPQVRNTASCFLASYPGGCPGGPARSKLRQVYLQDSHPEVKRLAGSALGYPQEVEHWEICLLGPFQLFHNAAPVDLVGKVRPLPLKLLKFFVAQGARWVAKELALEALWPEMPGDRASVAFNTAISGLRKQLSSWELLQRRGDCYRVNLDSQVKVDLVDFEESARLGLDLCRSGQEEQALQWLERAESLYGGDLLQGDNLEDWMLVRTRELNLLQQTCQERLIEVLIARSDFQAALLRCRRLLSRDGLNKLAQVRLSQCYQGLGQQPSS